MSPTLSGIELFMKAYLDTRPWVKENYLMPLPWGPVKLPPKIKIGVMWSDGVVKPHPPVLRGLRETVDALRANPGFEVVDWVPVDHDRCWEITCALYYEYGGKRLRKVLASGPEDALPLTSWLLEQEASKPRTVEEVWKVSLLRVNSFHAYLGTRSSPTSVSAQLKADRNSYRAMYNQHWLDTGRDDGHPVDAILSPVGPGCAPPHDQSKYWNYTSQWNLLEYPAIAFPVGQVDQNLDFPDTHDAQYVPKNKDDEFNHALYTGPERYRDAPISLQLITRKFEDEKCIEVLKRIEAAVGEAKHAAA